MSLITLFGGKYHRTKIRDQEREFLDIVYPPKCEINNLLTPSFEEIKKSRYIKHYIRDYVRCDVDEYFYLIDGANPSEFILNIIRDYIR